MNKSQALMQKVNEIESPINKDKIKDELESAINGLKITISKGPGNTASFIGTQKGKKTLDVFISFGSKLFDVAKLTTSKDNLKLTIKVLNKLGLKGK